jgi:2-phosphoxylose phosphatase
VKVLELTRKQCSYIWNSADNAKEYVQLMFGMLFQFCIRRHSILEKKKKKGVFFSELLQNFKSFQSGTFSHKLTIYVGHDGSMIRLASGLGFGRNGALRWPALGSEVVLEVRLVTFIGLLRNE